MSEKAGKESQYIVSCPRPDSDQPFRSNRKSGCDIIHTQYHNRALIPIVGVGIPHKHSDCAYRLHKKQSE